MNNILEHTQHNGRSLVAAVLLTAVAILAGSPSHAGDVKTIAAIGACAPAYSQEARNVEGTVSTSAEVVLVTCSLTRDLPQKPRLRRLDVEVEIDSAFPPASTGHNPPQCLAASFAIDGSQQVLIHTKYIQEGVVGKYTLRFNNIRMVRHGTLVIECYLPKKAKVHSIRIDE